MRTVAPDLYDPSAFEPSDLDTMQEAFDSACKRAGVSQNDAADRRTMAAAILAAYRTGERSPERLIQDAIKAAKAT